MMALGIGGQRCVPLGRTNHNINTTLSHEQHFDDSFQIQAEWI
jgi:hypothetical protein